jgi:hypothetical protein
MGIIKFDLVIERSVNTEALGWPESSRAAREGFYCNREYRDLRGCSWAEVDEVSDLENDIVRRLELSGTDFEQTMECVSEELDELYESGYEGLWGLDIGVASAVLALSACRCIPFSSCNAGAFGGFHREKFPLVSFFARPLWVPAIMRAAEETSIGLYNSDDAIVAYGEIRSLMSFSHALAARRSLFQNLKSQHKTPSRDSQAQIRLPFSSVSS